MNNTIWALLFFLPLALYFLNILLNVIDAELQQTHRQLDASSTISISKRTAYLPPHKRSLLLALERAFCDRFRVYPSAMLQDVINLAEHRDAAASEHPFAATSLTLAPMATPNCSTVGQSNCSRQDGVIMRGLK